MCSYHYLFEIRLCSAKERGDGRLGRVDTGLLARTLPSGTKEHANAHRQDALCPSPKIQKQAAFGIIPTVDGSALILNWTGRQFFKSDILRLSFSGSYETSLAINHSMHSHDYGAGGDSVFSL